MAKLRRGYSSEAAAQAASRALFAAMCPGGVIPQDSVTQYLCEWEEHPVARDWVLVVTPDIEMQLPAAERAVLVPDDRPPGPRRVRP